MVLFSGSMEEAEENLLGFDKAAGCERLIKATNGRCKVIDSKAHIDLEVVDDLVEIECEKMPVTIVHIGKRKDVSLFVLFDHITFHILASYLKLIYLLVIFEIILEDVKLAILVVYDADSPLRGPVDENGYHWELTRLYSDLVRKIFKNRRVVCELFVHRQHGLGLLR